MMRNFKLVQRARGFSGVSIAILVGVALSGCTQRSESPEEKSRATEIHSLAQKSQAVLVDVREADEIASGMIEGARWLPISKMDETNPAWKKFMSELPAGELKVSTPVGVYCRSGARSKRLIEKLNSLGYRTENLGGFSDLKSLGLPVSVPDPSLLKD